MTGLKSANAIVKCFLCVQRDRRQCRIKMKSGCLAFAIAHCYRTGIRLMRLWRRVYASLRCIAATAVRKAIASGRMSVEVDDTIDLATAERS